MAENHTRVCEVAYGQFGATPAAEAVVRVTPAEIQNYHIALHEPAVGAAHVAKPPETVHESGDLLQN